MPFPFSRAITSIALLGALGACNPAQEANAQVVPTMTELPEDTRLSISASATATAEPDVAFLTGGVSSEGRSANEALRKNADDMAGVYRALEAAGLERKAIQTSNFSLQPRYSYPKNAAPIVTGYVVSNTVTAKVTNMDKVGGIIDAMVAEGGNRFNGVSFSVQDKDAVLDKARADAMRTALERAKLYADVAGMRVKRIVTISENVNSYSPRPVPMAMARSMDMAESAPTQVSGGELSFNAQVNVVFELE